MNKRGFVQDIGMYTVILFSVAIGLLAVYYVFTEINTTWQNNDALPDVSKNMMSNFKDRYVAIWDSFYLFIVIGFLIVLVIMGFALRSHPVFAMLSLILLVIFGVIAVFFTNAYHKFASSPQFSALAQEFTMMNYLMLKLPHVIVVLSIVFIIVLFAKTKNPGVAL